MPRYRVAIGRPTGNGWERVEIGNMLTEIVEQFYADPEMAPYLEELIHIPIQRFPTSIARNMLVKKCAEWNHGPVDFIFMVDVDGHPKPGTFKAMFTFMRQQTVPCVIGAPYCSGDGEVQVFHYGTKQAHTQHGLDEWKIMRYTRDLAALQTGISKVAGIGTHTLLIDCRVFPKLNVPYFCYGANEDQTEVTETEDCYFMRAIKEAQVPIYCAWDFWSAHYKELRLEQPPTLPLDAIPQYYLRKAYAVVKEAQARDGWVSVRTNGEIVSSQNPPRSDPAAPAESCLQSPSPG
jgi:hypothetical protein